jgi:O-antigen/teichoic acid export membrane protein
LKVGSSSPHIERTARRLSAYFGGQVAVKLLYFPGIVLATRAAGPSGWGLITAAISVAFILSTGVNLGLNPYVTREVAAGKTPVARLTASTTRLRLASSVLFLLILPLVLTSTIRGIGSVVVLGISAYILADSWAKYYFALLRGAENTRFEILGGNLEKAVFVLFGALAWSGASRFDPTGVVAVGFAVAAVAKLAVAVYGAARVLSISAAPTARVLLAATRFKLWLRDLRYVRESADFLFMFMFTTVYFRADAYMVAAISGAGEAGYYGAAYRLIEGLLFAPESVLVVFSPLLVRALSRESESLSSGKLVNVVRQVAALQVAIAAPVGLGLMLEHEWITRALYGSEFDPAARVLLWLAPAYLFMSINFLAGGLLTAAYLQRALLVISGVAALANVLLNLILIPKYGAVGAVAATLVTEGAVGIGMLRRLAGRVPYSWIWKPIGTASAYFAVIVAVPNIILHEYLPFVARLLLGLVSTGIFLLLLWRRGMIPSPLAGEELEGP